VFSNWRKTLFRLHGWIGINLGLLLFVICLSGSVATLSHEIDGLLNPAQRAEVKDAPFDWSAIEASLQEAFPEGVNLGMYAPVEPGLAAYAYVSLPEGQTRKAYFDPYTGELQGHTSFFNTQRFFRSFHRRFFDGDRGIVLVTLTAIPLLLSALSGVLFYKGWLKQLFTIRRGQGRRLLGSDLHKVAGIWGLFFTILIAATGLFYLTEIGFSAAKNYDALLPEPLPDLDPTAQKDLGPQPEMLAAGALVAHAQAAFPELQVKGVRPPTSPSGAVTVTGQAGNPITRDRANKVQLNPYTGEVLGIQRSRELGVVPFITDAADPLHFGYFGGIWTKVLWCVLGLMLSFSILSGTYVWVVRSEPARPLADPADGKGSLFQPFPWLRGAVVSAALTIAYFGVATVSTIDGIQSYTPERAPNASVAVVEAGPYQIDVQCQQPCVPAEGATYVTRFLGAGMPNVTDVQVLAPHADPVAFEGAAQYREGAVASAPGTSLALRITEAGGAVHTASFVAPYPASQMASQTTSQVDAVRASWPDTAPGVWWVVAAFVVGTVASIVAWLWGVWRALRATQQKMRRKARRADGPRAPPGATLPPTATPVEVAESDG